MVPVGAQQVPEHWSWLEGSRGAFRGRAGAAQGSWGLQKEVVTTPRGAGGSGAAGGADQEGV